MIATKSWEAGISCQTFYQEDIMENENYNNNGPQGIEIACLILGVVSIISWLFSIGAFIGVGCGIAGLICASKAKAAGIMSGMRTGGFVCSLIGLIGSSLVFIISCLACLGIAALGIAGAGL